MALRRGVLRNPLSIALGVGVAAERADVVVILIPELNLEGIKKLITDGNTCVSKVYIPCILPGVGSRGARLH